MTHSSVPDVQPTLPPDGDNASSSDDDFVTAINAIMPPGLQLMKATCLSVCRERAEVQMSYELDERFVNVEGLICGGYTAQILDQTTTGAALAMTGMLSLTIDLHVNFVAGARPGKLVATGSLVHTTNSLAFTEARVTDAVGRLLARGSVTSKLVAPSAPDRRFSA